MPPDSAAERTRFSWRRTTLSATVVAALIVRLSLQRHHLTVIAPTALCWVFLLAVIQRRIAALKVLGKPPRIITMLTAAACLAFGGLGVVLVLAR
jgi:uncharacterized membrane protein YidH (DUF202 family)